MRMRIAAGLLLGLLVAGVAGAKLWDREILKPGPLPITSTIVLPRGAGLGEIARSLEDRVMVRHRYLFQLAAWTLGHGRDLKAGEYQVAAHSSLRDLVNLLSSGRVVVRRVVIPEGWTVRQAVAAIAQAEGMEGNTPDGIKEGELLPATYTYVWGDERGRMIVQMRSGMTQLLERLWRDRSQGLPLASPAEAVTLASIVEKETGRTDERAMVAGVFYNRLKARMKLQSDPTVIYGLAQGGEFGRTLTRADLKHPSPYNTYVVDGLPPGPIANPGRAALEAVFKPAQTDALYFVADGNGGHAFAKTLDEHNRNVARYRRIMRERGQPVPAAQAEE
ncbi:MAG: endolytic transglycosylase MltG [Alphaproteobacteria bacterium]|nr:endolytic transglycosylase MltG [Alphaproteobacteria bacterium]